MEPALIREVAATAHERGLTVEEALAHWQMAGAAAAGKQAVHWVSIAFRIAREPRVESADGKH
jgi:hypothetical protein